jgi:putative methanogenesis marker protein 14
MSYRARVIKPRTIGIGSLRTGPFYTVASVELGNTTTKCILVSTNLQTAEIFEIAKQVRFTRDVRPPKDGELVFGRTVTGVELTRESVSELISDILTSVLHDAHLDMKRDLHFVVRSTGVTAGFAKPSEVGEMVKALANGCIAAGVPPRKMAASISPENLPDDIRDFSWLKKVYFDGAVASSLPPSNAEVVANEMEGELVTAGIKGAVKGSDIDFRNPAMVLDFGTTLAGRVTDDSYPYAKTVGSFAGLAGAIPDALVRGGSPTLGPNGCALDLRLSSDRKRIEVDASMVEKARKLVRVELVSPSDSRFGTVPVNPQSAKESGVLLIGVDVGTNGSRIADLETLGGAFVEAGGLYTLTAAIDRIQADTVQRIVTLAETNGLVLDNTSLGLTGRAITTGTKPDLIAAGLSLKDGSLWNDYHQLVFVEDGLAMGAAVAARCMNSLGTRDNPMGGRKGDKCIMPERHKIQKMKRVHQRDHDVEPT